MGQSGNIRIKSNMAKLKFDNHFDIRKDCSLNIQSIRKIYLEISRNLSMGPLLSKYDWMGAHNSGPITPISFWAQIYFS